MMFRPEERSFARAVSRIAHDNPFSPERIESERVALGEEFHGSEQVWSVGDAGLSPESFHRERPNVVRLRELTWQTALRVRARLDKQRGSPSAEDLLLYEDLCLYAIF